MNEITVSICCITYNHEKYIEEALNSFLSQKTNFKYEIVVSNDCSTDNTQLVINKFKEKFPNLIKDVSPKENLGSIKNFYHTLNACAGKYIAYCEGDDYWTDEYKLQKQVDFLEKNASYGLCYTRSKKYIQRKHRFLNKSFGSDKCNYKDILFADLIPTQTILFSNDIYRQYYSEIDPLSKNWYMGDLPLLLFFSINSKIYYLNEITSVYRVLEFSSSHNKDFEKSKNFLTSSKIVKSFFVKKYSLEYDMNQIESRYIYNLYMKAFLLNDYKNFKIYYAQRKENESFKKTIILNYMAKSKILFKTIRFFYFMNNA